MGWSLPQWSRSRHQTVGMRSRQQPSRMLPIVEKLEDRTAPAVALFSGGVLSIDPTGSDQATLQDGADPGRQVRVLMSSGTLNLSDPALAPILALGSTSTDATFNLDISTDDVNRLRINYGFSQQNVVTFSGLVPASLLDLEVRDSAGAGSNLLIMAGNVDLSAATGGDLSVLASRLSMRLYGAISTGAGDIGLVSSLAGESLTISSLASPQLQGANITVEVDGKVGDFANPLVVQTAGLLTVYTQNADAHLESPAPLKLGNLDLGAATAYLEGAFSTRQGGSYGSSTTVDLPTLTSLTLAGNVNLRALTGSGSLATGGKALTLYTSGSATFNGTISDAGGSVHIAGDGTQVLGGANTYTGGSTVAAGATLVLTNDAGAGSKTIAVTSGGSLALSGGITVANNIFVGGAGVGGAGAIRNLEGANTLAGNIGFSTTTTFDTAAGSQLTAQGVISGSKLSGLTHTGNGTLVLAGTNTYGSNTIVSSGTVVLTAAKAASTVPILVADGATLWLDGSAGGMTIANQIQMEGTGTDGSGALISSGGNNTVSGGIILNSTAGIAATAPNTLTLSGVLSDGGTGRGVTILGSGTVILTNANTCTGITTISSGTLQLGNGGTTGSIAATEIVNDSALVFNRSNATTLSTLLSGEGTLTVQQGSVTLSSDNTASGPVFIASGATLQLGTGGGSGSLASDSISDNGSLVYNRSGLVTPAAVVSGSGSVSYQGTATYTVANANSYSGATSILAGSTLVISNPDAMGSGTASVASGAGLALDGSASSLAVGNALTLSGSGPGGEGALQNRGGINTVMGGIALATGSIIATAPGSTLTLSGVISDGGSTRGITHIGYGAGVGAGTLWLSANNTFAGTLNNVAGTVTLGTSTAAGTGPIVVANGTTLALNGQGASLSIANTIDISGSGVAGAGAIQNQLGSHTLSGAITLKSGVLIAPGTSLTTTSPISDGGKVLGLTLAGGGTMVTTAANTYTGTTNIQAGTTLQIGNGTNSGSLASGAVANSGALVFQRNDGTGAAFSFTPLISGTGTVTVTQGAVRLVNDNPFTGTTTVATGATLFLGNNGPTGSVGSSIIAVAGALNFNRNDAALTPFIEAASITGNGSIVVSTGAVALTADSTFNGSVSVVAGATLQLGTGGASGSFLANTVNNNGTLSFYRSGSQTIGTTVSGTGKVQFLGGGDYTLNQTNTYSGGTTIGTLQGTRVSLASSKAAGTGSIIVLDQSTLALTGNGLVVPNSISLAGSGVGGNGALLNTLGDNTLSGPITLTAGSIVAAASGTTLLASAAIGDGGAVYGLTIAGSGTFSTSATNTYSGTTQILTGATLRVGNGAATGSIASSAIVVNGTLAFNRSDATSINALISGAGTMRVDSGKVTLIADNTFTGSVTIANPATLIVGNGTKAGALPATTLTNNGQLVYSRSDYLGVTGTINGSGSVTYRSGGQFGIFAVNGYIGGTQVEGASTIRVASSSALGTGLATLTNTSVMELDGSLGNLILGNPFQLDSTGTVIENQVGNNQITGRVTLGGNTVINRYSGTSLAISGGLAESGGVPRDLKVTGNGTLLLSGAGTQTGGTLVSAGRLTLANNTAAGQGAILVIAGAALQLDGTVADLSIANSLVLAGSGPFSTGALVNLAGDNTLTGNILLAGTIESFVENGSLRLTGVISDAGNIHGITSRGNGTLELAGVNTYAGPTSVYSGNLLLTNDSAAGTGLISVLVDGTLQISGSIDLANAIRLSGDGVAGAGSLQVLDGDNAILGAITLTNDSTIALSGISTLQVDGVIDDGALDNSLTVTGPDGSYLVLTADNTFTGSTTIIGTGVILGDGTAASGSLASQSIIFNAGGGLGVYRTDTPASPFVISAVISGDGEFAVFQGAVELSGKSTYTGTTFIDAGSLLQIAEQGSLESPVFLVLGELEYQQTGPVNLTAEYFGDGVILFTMGLFSTNTFALLTDSPFTGSLVVGDFVTLQVSCAIPASVILGSGSILTGSGVVGAIIAQAGLMSIVVPGQSNNGFLTATDLDFASQGAMSFAITDTGSTLTSTGLILNGGLDADLNSSTLILTPINTIANQGTVLTLINFTQGGSVGTSRFTDNTGAVLEEGAEITIAPGVVGTLHYHFGSEANDVVLLMVNNFSAYTYDASAGTLRVELGEDTNLAASDLGASTSLIISPASTSPIAWVQFGGDAIDGATATALLINPALTGQLIISQRSTVATGSNSVALNGLTVRDNLTVALTLGESTAITIGGSGLDVTGSLLLASYFGSITQTAPVDVAGASFFSAATEIALNSQANRFGGAVTASAGGLVQLFATGTLSTATVQASIVTLNATGNLSVGVTTSSVLNFVASGSITQTGPAISTGLVTINALGTVLLDHPANDFSSLVILVADGIRVQDASNLTLTRADNVSGNLVIGTIGNLNLRLPGGVLRAAGDISLTTAAADSHIVMDGATNQSITSTTGGILIASSRLEAIGSTLGITAVTSLELPETVLLSTTGMASITINAESLILNGLLRADGKTGASVNCIANTASLATDGMVRAYDQSGGNQESINLAADILGLAGTPNLVLGAGGSILVSGTIGTSSAPLGNVDLVGGSVVVTGSVYSLGNLLVQANAGATSLGGNIVANNMRVELFGTSASLEVPGSVTLAGTLTLRDTSAAGVNRFDGAIQAAELVVTASSSALVFANSVALTGQADFSLLGSNGVEFDNTLIASQLNLNQSAGAYPVTLLGNTTITNLVTFNNGGEVTLGDNGNEVFYFRGGLNQITGASTILAMGTIRTNSAPVAISGLVVNGQPLAIDTTGTGIGAAIQILGPVDIVSGLTLKGLTNTFSGASTLTRGLVAAQQGGLTLGAGEAGFVIGEVETDNGPGSTLMQTGGKITLNNADLALNLGDYAPGVGMVFTLVDNTGSAMVSGIFNGLPEGATYTVDGQSFIISYLGGASKNDITARVVRSVPLPVGPVVAQPFSLEPGSLVAGIGLGQVRIRSANGVEQVITPFPFYTGSVNLATVDRSGDGVADAVVVMVAGGASPAVVVIDSATGRVSQSFYAFAPQFMGGGTVTGGLVNLNGVVTTIIAVGAGAGAEPSVTIFDAVTGQNLNRNFYAYAQSYTGGVTVAMTSPDIKQNSFIIAASVVNSHVTLFDIHTAVTRTVSSFYAFSPSDYLQPISVAGGQLMGADGKLFSAIIVGSATGWAPSVVVFSTAGMAQKAFYAFSPNFLGGVRVGVSDLNRDGLLEIMAGSGPGTRGTLNVYDYNSLALIDAVFLSENTDGVTLGSNLTV